MLFQNTRRIAFLVFLLTTCLFSAGKVAGKDVRVVSGTEMLMPVASEIAAAGQPTVETASLSLGVTVSAPSVSKLRSGLLDIVSQALAVSFITESVFYSIGTPVQTKQGLFLIHRQLLIWAVNPFFYHQYSSCLFRHWNSIGSFCHRSGNWNCWL